MMSLSNVVDQNGKQSAFNSGNGPKLSLFAGCLKYNLAIFSDSHIRRPRIGTGPKFGSDETAPSRHTNGGGQKMVGGGGEDAEKPDPVERTE